jgi:hypothetical protein
MLTLAPHVEALSQSNYTRPLSSSTEPTLNAKRLSIPNGGNETKPPFPSTSARPDQRVNVRFPVTRVCHSRLVAGQVAFVARNYNQNFGPAGISSVLSLEELNATLSKPEYFARGGLYVEIESKHMWNVDKDEENKYKPTRPMFSAFDSKGLVDEQHPVNQFALDGLIATRVEDVEDFYGMSDGFFSQQLCIVAAKGHCPMMIPPNSQTFIRPAVLLAKVYVVLVAVPTDTEDVWKFQYETVSSSNLDLDEQFAPGHRLFRTEMRTAEDGRGDTIANVSRFVLRVMQLGTIVDTNFGPAAEPQLVVCVHVTPFERTRTETELVDGTDVTFRVPMDVGDTFKKEDRRKQQPPKKVVKLDGFLKLARLKNAAMAGAAAAAPTDAGALGRLEQVLGLMQKKIDDLTTMAQESDATEKSTLNAVTSGNEQIVNILTQNESAKIAAYLNALILEQKRLSVAAKTLDERRDAELTESKAKIEASLANNQNKSAVERKKALTEAVRKLTEAQSALLKASSRIESSTTDAVKSFQGSMTTFFKREKDAVTNKVQALINDFIEKQVARDENSVSAISKIPFDDEAWEMLKALETQLKEASVEQTRQLDHIHILILNPTKKDAVEGLKIKLNVLKQSQAVQAQKSEDLLNESKAKPLMVGQLQGNVIKSTNALSVLALKVDGLFQKSSDGYNRVTATLTKFVDEQVQMHTTLKETDARLIEGLKTLSANVATAKDIDAMKTVITDGVNAHVVRLKEASKGEAAVLQHLQEFADQISEQFNVWYKIAQNKETLKLYARIRRVDVEDLEAMLLKFRGTNPPKLDDPADKYESDLLLVAKEIINLPLETSYDAPTIPAE